MNKKELLMKAGMNLLDENDNLISERDEIRDWLINLGELMAVDAKSEGDSVQENWALFRKDIFDKIKEK